MTDPGLNMPGAEVEVWRRRGLLYCESTSFDHPADPTDPRP